MTNTRTATTQKANRYLGALAALVVMAITLALAAVMAMGVSADNAEAATAVTKSFDNPTEIRIPGAAVVDNCSAGPTQGTSFPYGNHISVSSFSRGSRIQDVNLTLKGFTHTFPDDVDMVLVHTKGTSTRNRTIMSDVGGSIDVNGANITLDDEARFNNFMPNDGPLVTDRYFPTNVNQAFDDNFPAPAPDNTTRNADAKLSGFDGQKANGSWDLYMRDDAGGDCGKIAGDFSLQIQAS